jgi:predicted DNA-binding protein with PD1-like motif
MNVCESKRTRHLVLRLGRGDEIPAAIVRALDEAEARSAWIRGVGALSAAEIATYDQGARRYAKARRIEGGCEAISIEGNASTLDGVTTLRLTASLARETDKGLDTVAGQLVWARAFDLDLFITALDDVTLTRVADDATGLPALVARGGATNAIPERAAPERAAPERAAPERSIPERVIPADKPSSPVAHAPPAFAPPPPPPQPTYASDADTPPPEVHALPQKPMRPQQDLEAPYPEAGDRVTHFAFGECTVLSSDGDRIRLQQDKDSRVREVALTMLRIEDPTDLPDGKKHFKLARKN